MLRSSTVFDKSKYYLILILLFIFADVICDNYIFHTFNDQSKFTQLILSLVFFVIQIFASPIQSGFSDLYCRKKSLVISLSFSTLALILTLLHRAGISAYFPVLVILIFIKGALGNTIPIAWASIADTQEKDFRFSFGLSTAFFAIGYLALINAEKYLNDFTINLLVICLFIVLVFLCIALFRDIRDKKNVLLKRKDENIGIKEICLHELQSILGRLRNSHVRNGVFAFYLWELSLYSILMLYVDFGINEFSSTGMIMMMGYLWGIVVLKYSRKVHDELIIKFGYFLLSFSLIPVFVYFGFTSEFNYILLSLCYFFHAWGNAFLSAAFFAMLSKRSQIHEQGKNYGLVESADTCALLSASIVIMCYKSSFITFFCIVVVSFLTAIVSWIPYRKFKTAPLKL